MAKGTIGLSALFWLWPNGRRGDLEIFAAYFGRHWNKAVGFITVSVIIIIFIIIKRKIK
jgi:hypothetical protein